MEPFRRNKNSRLWFLAILMQEMMAEQPGDRPPIDDVIGALSFIGCLKQGDELAGYQFLGTCCQLPAQVAPRRRGAILLRSDLDAEASLGNETLQELREKNESLMRRLRDALDEVTIVESERRQVQDEAGVSPKPKPVVELISLKNSTPKSSQI